MLIVALDNAYNIKIKIFFIKFPVSIKLIAYSLIILPRNKFID